MGKNELRSAQDGMSNGSPQGGNHQETAGPQLQEVQVNNRALLSQYVEAATLAQERLLAYLSGVLGERGVVGQVRGWDVARGVIMVAGEPESSGPPGGIGPAGAAPGRD